jgi:DNA-damage-inducible protein J
MHRGIPFDVKLLSIKPAGVSALSESELGAELEKGYSDYVQDKTKPAMKAFSDIHKDYDL